MRPARTADHYCTPITVWQVSLTRNTTDTFSVSTTPASGSASISSPGPGIARFMLTVSVDLLALFVLKEAISSFFDAVEVTDRIELGFI